MFFKSSKAGTGVTHENITSLLFPWPAEVLSLTPLFMAPSQVSSRLIMFTMSPGHFLFLCNFPRWENLKQWEGIHQLFWGPCVCNNAEGMWWRSLQLAQGYVRMGSLLGCPSKEEAAWALSVSRVYLEHDKSRSPRCKVVCMPYCETKSNCWCGTPNKAGWPEIFAIQLH